MPWFGRRRPYGILAFGNARDDSGDAMNAMHWNIYRLVTVAGFDNVALRFGRIGSSSARSPPSRRRTRGPPETAGIETALTVQASSFKLPTSHFELLPPFPSGRPARYGNVRPTDYRDTPEHLLAVRHFKLRTSPFALHRPFLPPVSIPPSMASACVFGSASMHSQFHFHHP
jgi:hypothetical protein